MVEATSSSLFTSEAYASVLSEGDVPFSSDIDSRNVSVIGDQSAEGSYFHTIFQTVLSFYNQVMDNSLYLNSSCSGGCSGRGECMNGTCFCSVQYGGENCKYPNIAYFASFSCIFFFIAAISLGQLVVCIRSEYNRLKTPTIRRACSITTQKMLYVITFIAASVRGAYFSSPSNAELTLATSFFSSFYPAILSGGSLIVCFWAEHFHLRDIGCERPRFLSKSFLGFITFNTIVYSLFLAEVILQQDSVNDDERRFLTHVFNGCYAVLMFIMVVFFLIYGVEVYFKVRGGFVTDTLILSGTLHSRDYRQLTPASTHLDTWDVINVKLSNESEERDCLLHEQECEKDLGDGVDVVVSASQSSMSHGYSVRSHRSFQKSISVDDVRIVTRKKFLKKLNSVRELKTYETVVNEEEKPVKGEVIEPPCDLGKIPKMRIAEDTMVASPAVSRDPRGVDYSQLSQSRFGLVFQACMFMITVCFLFSDVLGGFWKNRVPLISRNAYDVVFRVVELGVALWFPCVLWNCIAPEQLWILNPRKILKQIDIDKSIQVAQVDTAKVEVPKSPPGDDESESDPDSTTPVRECWICYESASDTPAGPLIEPCLCRGDVAAVHHNCLRKWLMECVQNNNTEQLACKVCRAEYVLERSPNWWIGQGFTSRHWLHTASLVTVMCGTIAGSWAVLQLYQSAVVRSITAGSMLLVLYLCLRFLGFNTFTAYQRARYSAVKILSKHFSSSSTAGRSRDQQQSDAVGECTETCSRASIVSSSQVTVDIVGHPPEVHE